VGGPFGVGDYSVFGGGRGWVGGRLPNFLMMGFRQAAKWVLCEVGQGCTAQGQLVYNSICLASFKGVYDENGRMLEQTKLYPNRMDHCA
jgi:hypothetical protein